MNESEFNSTWVAAIRKQRRQMWTIVLVSFAIPAAMVIFGWVAMPGFGWLAIVLLVAMLPMPFVIYRVAKQQRRLNETIPKHAGIVCPYCIVYGRIAC